MLPILILEETYPVTATPSHIGFPVGDFLIGQGSRPFPSSVLWNAPLELVLRVSPFQGHEKAGRVREQCLTQDMAWNHGPSGHVRVKV